MRSLLGYMDASGWRSCPGVRMQMFFFLILAVVIYGLLADRMDRAADRELQKRRPDASDLGLVEDFDARPDLGPQYGRRLRAQVDRARESHHWTSREGSMEPNTERPVTSD